jgi:hypothetical protein
MCLLLLKFLFSFLFSIILFRTHKLYQEYFSVSFTCKTGALLLTRRSGNATPGAERGDIFTFGMPHYIKLKQSSYFAMSENLYYFDYLIRNNSIVYRRTPTN